MTAVVGNEAELLDLAKQIHSSMFRIASAIRRREYIRVGEGELTLTQCSILYILQERGATRIADIAALEAVRPPTATMAISRLESLGMVSRRRDKFDKRVVWVEVTRKGIAAQKDSVALLLNGMRANMSPADLETLRHAMSMLERLAALTESEMHGTARDLDSD